MSHLDPFGGPATPRGRPLRPDETVGDGRDARHRARHGGAAPDPYAPEPYAGDDRHAGAPAGGPYPASFTEAYPPVERDGAGRYDGPPGGSGAGPETAAYPVVPSLDGAAAVPAPAPTRTRGGHRRRGRRPVDPSATGRAGRNLPAAVGVGVALVALVLGPLFIWQESFVGVIAVAVTVGIWEMTRAVRAVDANPPLVPLFGGGLLMTGVAWYAGPTALTLGLLVTVLAAMVWRLPDGRDGYRRDLTATTLIAVYVPFLAGFAVLLAVPAEDGAFRVLVTLAAVVFSDTGGYAFGVFLGRRPMAPTISPKKSWEGFGGSVFTTAVGSAVLLWLLLDVAPWQGALFGAAISVAAVLGDLSESMLKRDLGIKDMSQLLPGHGGLMDRLDSILLAAPTAYLLLWLLAPPT